MTQERFWNFKDDDSTNRLNQRDLVMIPYGLYCGFDPVLAAGLNLTLEHATAAQTKVKQDLTVSNPLGIWKSKQGVVIVEDADIVLAIAAGHATLPRIDLIAARHKYVATTGGANATYAVIQGTPNASPVAPALTFPNEQIILGQIYIPALTANLNDVGVIYTKVDPVSFGSNPFLMLLNQIQTSTELKTFNVLKGLTVVATLDAPNNKIVLPSASNYYSLAKTNNVYEFIDDFELLFNGDASFGKGQSIFIHTLQRLTLVNKVGARGFLIRSSQNNLITGMDSDSDFIKIEENTVIEFVDISASAVTANSKWLCLDNGNLRKGYVNKLEHMMINAQDFVIEVPANGHIGWANGTGAPSNYIRLDVNVHSVAEIKSMESLEAFTEVAGEANGIVYLFIAGGDVLFANSFGGTYIDFVTPNGLPVTATSGSIVVCIQNVVNWKIIDIISPEFAFNTVNDQILAVEHHFTKLQADGYIDLGVAAYDGANGNPNSLVLTDEGNHFQVEVDPYDIDPIDLDNILIQRGVAVPTAFPTGSLITIRFIHSVFVHGLSEPFRFFVNSTSNIRSSIDDVNRDGGGTANLWHIPVEEYSKGDGVVVTLRKTDTKWDIVSHDMEGELAERIKDLAAIVPVTIPCEFVVPCSDELTPITTGTTKMTFRVPFAFTLTEVRASVNVAPTGSTIVIDINENGTTVLSTKLSIDTSEKTSTTAGTPAVISDANIADDSEITFDFDQVGSTIAGAGVKVTLKGTRTL